MKRDLFFAAPAVLLLFAGAGVLSWRIDKGLNEGSFRFNLENSLNRILGSAKEAVGDTLFLKADSYYHGGQTRDFVESPEELEREGAVEGREHGHKPARGDWISEVNRKIRSHEHIHLAKDKQKEMLPFFALATALDPHNTEALLTTAYWLDRHFGRPDEAIEVLKKGMLDNGDSWELEFNLAHLYFSRKKDYGASERHYLAAIRKAARHEVERHFRIDMYYFLAESCLHEGKKAEALEAYRKALQAFEGGLSTPLKERIQAKIQELI